ncbi:lanthionine synthetase C family protein [Dactylosporangium vinaceum]|uniref:Lanthionine synthetase C family protein n=1 Tax=Dactylosporangium vinaceum TaxID=53362 RepID=A0ABV5M2P5_9ACTN|nr:lanthionine synthetase C family protein [Dactylosporangium vinaceum]UAB96342.1 lanthionine synthetase C family protein [Dactylosporangium vinaceum]
MTAPTVDPGERDRAAAACERLSVALAEPARPVTGDDARGRRWHGQSLYRGAAGTAVLHGVRAQTGDDPPARVRTWLTEATREDVSAASTAGLWFGAPAVGFAVATAAPGLCPATLQQLDTAVARLIGARLDAAEARIVAGRRPPLAEFDLVRGLTGLGAYLLHRTHSDSRPDRQPSRPDHGVDGDLARRVVAYLVQLTEPLPRAVDEFGADVPGWWSGAVPSGETAHRYPGGHIDLGIAHGISGPLAFLALAMRRGLTVPGQAEAIDRVCRFLDHWRQNSPAGAWWPERIGRNELHHGRPRQTGPARPSWCYGTPGIARACQLAAVVLGDTARQQAAERALADCLDDPGQLRNVLDARLCHGWAGIAATAWHAAHDAATDRIAGYLPRLLSKLTALAEQIPAPSQPAREGLIDGDAGIALTLQSMITTTASVSWPTCLLLA